MELSAVIMMTAFRCVTRCVFTIDVARRLATDDFESVRSQLKKIYHTKFQEHAASVLVTVEELQREYATLNMRYLDVQFNLCYIRSEILFSTSYINNGR